jgi:hypothetical protein
VPQPHPKVCSDPLLRPPFAVQPPKNPRCYPFRSGSRIPEALTPPEGPSHLNFRAISCSDAVDACMTRLQVNSSQVCSAKPQKWSKGVVIVTHVAKQDSRWSPFPITAKGVFFNFLFLLFHVKKTSIFPFHKLLRLVLEKTHCFFDGRNKKRKSVFK